jgi:Na+/H+ antiporter NhaC
MSYRFFALSVLSDAILPFKKNLIFSSNIHTPYSDFNIYFIPYMYYLYISVHICI